MDNKTDTRAESRTKSQAKAGAMIVPVTLFVIFLLLFVLYGNVKFPLITVLGVLLSAPAGAILAQWFTNTPFSVSSGIGYIVLFGVSVLTAVVYISYVNELRRSGMALDAAIREGAILRLRPIMMTALVAALGLLPAALASGVGTDSQRPFALVIVAALWSLAAVPMNQSPNRPASASRIRAEPPPTAPPCSPSTRKCPWNWPATKAFLAPMKCSTSMMWRLVAMAPRVAKETDRMVAASTSARMAMPPPIAVPAIARMRSTQPR